MSTATQTATVQKMKTPSLWKVMFHNDDFTPMDFVTHVLMEVFHKNVEEAQTIMLAVHENGKANVAVYTKEIAIAKVQTVSTLAEAFGHPLKATAEEA